MSDRFPEDPEHPDFTETGKKLVYRPHGQVEIHPDQLEAHGADRDTTSDGTFVAWIPLIDEFELSLSGYQRERIIVDAEHLDMWIETLLEIRHLAKTPKTRAWHMRFFALISGGIE